jgi:exonuclease III
MIVLRDSVKSLFFYIQPSIVCLQETKLCSISDFDILSILGLGYSNFVYNPAHGTRGGVFLWHGAMDPFPLVPRLSRTSLCQYNFR